jgi:hypothetical protein
MVNFELLLADFERKCSGSPKEPVVYFINNNKQRFFHMCKCCERAVGQLHQIILELDKKINKINKKPPMRKPVKSVKIQKGD